MLTNFKKGDLVVYKPSGEVMDDQTGEITKTSKYKGIGVITGVDSKDNNFVKIWWQKHPFEDPNKFYSTLEIQHYIFNF